jgi:hypothetical protein
MNSGFDFNGTGGADLNLMAVLCAGDENLNTPGVDDDIADDAYGFLLIGGPVLKNICVDGDA